jgi:signal transduction histidine kinase
MEMGRSWPRRKGRASALRGQHRSDGDHPTSPRNYPGSCSQRSQRDPKRLTSEGEFTLRCLWFVGLGTNSHRNVDNRLGQIQADERKVRQVVLNLLSNAIKFTPEGGRIEVGAVPRDGFVEVSVSDTGVGIAPQDQEAVFEEFRQVGTAEKKAEGTGLGLTLCRKFVELHGGRIWVKSQVGEGSTFTFTIPVRRDG